jgi:hypothetical protein
MSAQRRVTTRPEGRAEVVTNSLRPDSREISASLNVSADPFSEPPRVFKFGGMHPLSKKESRLTVFNLDRAFSSRLSLRLT